MLLSMTGYGEASYQSEKLSLGIELRAVNNRYLKVILRAGEPYTLLEGEFEKVVRRTIKRGTLQIHLRCQRQYELQDFPINAVALRSYLTQLRNVCAELGLPENSSALVAQILALPGVAPEPATFSLKLDKEWPLIERVLQEALDRLQTMRQDEGRAMAQELLLHRDHILAELDCIRQRAPQVALLYRDRLLERLRDLLREKDVQIDASDILKEVSIFAERSDIAEEIVRLASHLEQFQAVMNESESAGRKLEFLTQEMFREANTIGSKAGDVEISRRVVEVKATLEKIRELVQNVE